MRLLLDQGLPRSAAELLRQTGHDVIHAGECGLASASDEEILAVARREEPVVATLDADFHALLALSKASRPSVIRIRILKLRGQPLAELVERVWRTCEADLLKGALVAVTEQHIRVHQLPVGTGRQ